MRKVDGFSLVELMVVTGLLASLVGIVAAIMSSNAGIIQKVEYESQAKISLLKAQVMLDRYLGQAINIAGESTLPDNSKLDANLLDPGTDFFDLRTGAGGNTTYYHDENSRILFEYDSLNETHRTTTRTDGSPAANKNNVDLLALFFFEDTPSSGDTARNFSTTIGAAAIYFQRPTNFSSGVLYVVKTVPQNTAINFGSDLSLPPCRENCPANVESEFVDGLSRVAISHLIYPPPNPSRTPQIVPANIAQDHDYTAPILDPPSTSTPPASVRIILEARKFNNLDQSTWGYCNRNALDNCPQLTAYRDLNSTFEITFRNNIFYQGSMEDPSTIGSDEAHLEERVLGNLYFFKFHFRGIKND